MYEKIHYDLFTSFGFFGFGIGFFVAIFILLLSEKSKYQKHTHNLLKAALLGVVFGIIFLSSITQIIDIKNLGQVWNVLIAIVATPPAFLTWITKQTNTDNTITNSQFLNSLDKLGNDSFLSKIGAINTLESILKKDYENYGKIILETFCNFLREFNKSDKISDEKYKSSQEYLITERLMKIIGNVKNQRNFRLNLSNVNLDYFSSIEFTGGYSFSSYHDFICKNDIILNFSNIDFSGSSFKNTKLNCCNFENCNFTSVYFYKSEFIKCNFNNSIIKSHEITFLNLSYSNLRKVKINYHLKSECDEDIKSQLEEIKLFGSNIEHDSETKIEFHIIKENKIFLDSIEKLYKYKEISDEKMFKKKHEEIYSMFEKEVLETEKPST